MDKYYKGMRWLKCDLHMHTPADQMHWRGEKFENEEAAALAFAEACHEAELDVIAVTDHNFISKDFIPLLQKALREANTKYKHNITLFIGFEFEAAGVGRGEHVLAIFDPKTEVNEVDHIVTECGINFPRINNGVLEKSKSNLNKILEIVQNKHNGLVILPHSLDNNGAFCNNNISEWLQREQHLCSDLLAIEVNKTINEMNSSFQKLFKNGDDCLEEWKRERRIALLMSSDCKKLNTTDSFDKPEPNSIGYRYSWIKMSSPSIESLRQAFLDCTSRIILQPRNEIPKNPERCFTYPFVKSIEIYNAKFLKNQSIAFSPNLNCIIGGRGSGKSTILEYLRLALGKDHYHNKDHNIDQGTQNRIERALSTLNIDSEIKVEWKYAGTRDSKDVLEKFIYKSKEITILNDEVIEISTILDAIHCDIYSQQQINTITDVSGSSDLYSQSERILSLIDGFKRLEMDDIHDKCIKTEEQIRESYRILDKINSLTLQKREAEQNQIHLDRTLDAYTSVQAEADRHKIIKNEGQNVEKNFAKMKEIAARFESCIQDLQKNSLFFEKFYPEHESFLGLYCTQIVTLCNDYANNFSKINTSFQTAVQNLYKIFTQSNVYKDISECEQIFLRSCAQKGLNPEALGQLKNIQAQKITNDKHIDNLTTQIKTLTTSYGIIDDKFKYLKDLWMKEFNLRQEIADNLPSLASNKGCCEKLIKISVQYQRDRQHFLQLWMKLQPTDKRKRLGRDWESIGEELFELYSNDLNDRTPWEFLESILETTDISSIVKNSNLSTLHSEIKEYLLNESNRDKYRELRMSRVRDAIDVELFRSDGTLAGSVMQGTLSDGQRNTVALLLLLSQGDGPLIIDQPEDELDSNFVFHQLVPILREAKNFRQIILVTHNPNLPVNADAEFVYALETDQGLGKCRACGGLDNKKVTEAVLDIMEGSEEAFKRRREKYHF